jgi:hypothetical protein
VTGDNYSHWDKRLRESWKALLRKRVEQLKSPEQILSWQGLSEGTEVELDFSTQRRVESPLYFDSADPTVEQLVSCSGPESWEELSRSKKLFVVQGQMNM